MTGLCHRSPRRIAHSLRVLGAMRVLVTMAVAIGVMCGSPAWAQRSELAVKVAYVFNLTKYVEWPTPVERIVIGIVGDGPMSDKLRELSGKVSDSRVIVVLDQPSDADLKHCALVYVTYSSGKKIEEVLAKLSGQSVLTVGDAGSFSRQGGMVTLLTVGERIDLEINLQACREVNLKISSKLLSLAKIVVTNGGAG